jgi:hypothetical protein
MHTIKEAQQFNNLAREVFTKDGCHIPMVILVKGKEHFVLPLAPLMKDGAGKDAISLLIRKSIQDFGISGVVMITEAWMHVATDKDDEVMRQIIDGEKSVSEVATRQEILMIQAESDDGLSVSFTNPINRDADGNPTLGDVEVVNERPVRFFLYVVARVGNYAV